MTAAKNELALALAATALLLASGQCRCGDRTGSGTAAGQQVAPRSPRVTLTTAGGRQARVDVEVVRTTAERDRGLMNRRSLGDNQGMFFIFEEEQVRHFWMKDTYLALDMIFISSDMRIVGIVANAEPQSTAPRTVGLPSQYVLEVNAGWTRAHGVRAGARVSFEPAGSAGNPGAK